MFRNWKEDGFLDTVRRLAEEYVIVVCNGCFDLLHPGHVGLLEWARSAPFSPDAPAFERRQSCVIAAVNGDESVKKIKGLSRPTYPLADRLYMLTGLKSVSLAVGFDELTPLELYQQLPGFVLVKGSEFAKDRVPGMDIATWTTFAPMAQMQTLLGERDYSTSLVTDQIVTTAMQAKDRRRGITDE